uniref:Uncharacterized protein n=1 Tax=Nelumbo nucifera TaxID=4432 RepID=A0A822YXX0_NELNU|nr:TPA_asm: hypothetical protein HUJ06_008038 [Nelumbo nucifera]
MKFQSDIVLLPGRKHQDKVFFGQN